CARIGPIHPGGAAGRGGGRGGPAGQVGALIVAYECDARTAGSLWSEPAAAVVISRADVAHFMLRAFEQPATKRVPKSSIQAASFQERGGCGCHRSRRHRRRRRCEVKLSSIELRTAEIDLWFVPVMNLMWRLVLLRLKDAQPSFGQHDARRREVP